jgi:predicted SAM-dependent methyltransferase
MLKLLNLGCGSRFLKDTQWINIDFNPQHREVISHDLRKGIPLADQSINAVYQSHFLEHFSKGDAIRLIRECFRVLKPGGTIRIVVPDLENICRLYLEGLEKVLSGDIDWQSKYDWIMLEMYDQAVRIESGGEMYKYLCQPDLRDEKFIIDRIGSVARDIIKLNVSLAPRIKAMRNQSFIRLIVKVQKKFRRLILAVILNKDEMKALNLGFFRLSGEVHHWMYDRYSLSRLLQENGFAQICQCSAAESGIPDWNKYYLDIDTNGFIVAPSSLYMEGVKHERE